MSLAAYVTDIGKARLAAAAAGGGEVVLATGALGDGGGAPITPSPAMTALVNQVWSAPLSSLGLDPQNPSTILVEFVVPVNAGGWTAREAGVFADDGALIAVAAFPETYKPLPDDGLGTSFQVVVPIPVVDAASVVFNVDSNQIYVSRYAFDQEVAELQGIIDDHAGRTDNPHQVSCAQIGAALEGHGHPALEAHPPRTDNPHQVTCAQIGAALDSHLHDSRYGGSLALSGQVLTLVSRAGASLGSVTMPAAVPVGTVAQYPGATPPSGWLERNGAAISRAAYAELFAVIGTTFGAGDGSTTFNLPDDRGLFDRNWDHGRGVDPGRALGSEQADEVKSHRHRATDFSDGKHAVLSNGTGVVEDGLTPQLGSNTYPVLYTGDYGGSETRPRNRAYLPIIKY